MALENNGTGQGRAGRRVRRRRRPTSDAPTPSPSTSSAPDLQIVPDPPISDVRAALPDLYEAHYRSLVRLASFSVDDRETAEEVVQDAFVKLVAGNYHIDPGKELGYLRSMVLNGARSALRKRQVRRAHTPDAPGLVAAAEEAGVASTEHDRMIEALRQLPDKQASVLVLRYYLDLSEADIADTLGIARGSVKSHAHRGLKRLGDVLGDENLSRSVDSPTDHKTDTSSGAPGPEGEELP